MCELLGMSANVPTDICFSFSGLVQRGGRTGPHVDGWGITFYEGKGCRTFKDPVACAQSQIAKLVQEYPIKSQAVIGHIRQANRGQVALENTHPFTRELWGRNWTFAHNGQLSNNELLETGRFIPVGETDSERAFCWILHQLEQRYSSTTAPEMSGEFYATLFALCRALQGYGVFNLLLSDGQYLFAFCSTNLHWLTRCAPFGKATLIDDDVSIDFQKQTSANDVVTVLATQPLTSDERWQKMDAGQFVIFHEGKLVLQTSVTDVCPQAPSLPHAPVAILRP